MDVFIKLLEGPSQICLESRAERNGNSEMNVEFVYFEKILINVLALHKVSGK